MSAQAYKDKSFDELQQIVLDYKKELFNLRFQRAAGQLENTSRFRIVRREVARIKTEITRVKQK